MKKTFSIFRTLLLLAMMTVAGASGAVAWFYFTNEDVAREIQQIRLPKPNRFFVGIDVSASIPHDMLADLKDVLVRRLEKFVGEKTVYYGVSVFGLPGCGDQAVGGVVAGRSPKDLETFSMEIEYPIRSISAVQTPENRDTSRPLATPLFHFLEKILTAGAGERIVVFSDLVNDDRGCPRQAWFPMGAFEKFGKSESGQLIFIYPDLSDRQSANTDARKARQQKIFVNAVEKLVKDGKIRAFLYPIPYESKQRRVFLETHLQEAIPETVVEVFVERASKAMGAIVAAARG